MSDIVKREIAQVGRKLIGGAVIRLPLCQLFQMPQSERTTYDPDRTLE